MPKNIEYHQKVMSNLSCIQESTISLKMYRIITPLVLALTLSGCQTLYYNPNYLDIDSARVNFEKDQVRCRAYANGLIQIPPTYQVQNYQYQVDGHAYVQPTFGGYEMTYDAQVTATPSLADTMFSTMNSFAQLASIMARENKYENCLKELGWTKNKKEAFPNDDLLLEAPSSRIGSIEPDFYKPVPRAKKLPFSISVQDLNLSELVFKNGNHTYTLDVKSFDIALQKELAQHFSKVTHSKDADIYSFTSVRFMVSPTEKKYSGQLTIQFKDKAGRPIQGVWYQNIQTVPTNDNKLDSLSKLLTKQAMTDLIEHTGWLMNQREFRESFSHITP